MNSTLRFFSAFSLLLCATAALAKDPIEVKIPPGGAGLSYTYGSVTAYDVPCPEEHTCFTAQTNVKLTLNIGGCFDIVGPVAYEVADNDLGDAEVYVAASRIANKNSLTALCPKLKTEEFEFPLWGAYDKVLVHFLGTNVDVEAKVESPAKTPTAPNPN
jgi:hypothetical protein